MQGRKMKETTKKLRALSDIDMIKLINKHEFRSIAEMFNVSVGYISLELTRRNLYLPTKKVSLQPEQQKYYYTSREDEEFSNIGAWMYSNERKLYKQLKTNNNEQFKY